MMRLYLAGRTTAAPLLRTWRRDILIPAGYLVTSRWLDEPLVGRSQALLQDAAERDWVDIGRAQAILLYNPRGSGFTGHGGRHVEIGLGLAWNLSVILIGQPSNIFHYLPQIISVKTIEEAIPVLDHMQTTRRVNLRPWNNDR